MSGPNSFFFLLLSFLGSPPFFFFVFIFGFDCFGFFGGRVVRGMKSVKSVSQSVNQSAGHSVNWSNLLAAGR